VEKNVLFFLVASSRSLKGLRTSSSSEWPSEPSKGNSLDSDECSLSSGTQSSGCPVAESRRDSKSTELEKDAQEGLAEFPDGLIKESDILSDEDEDFHHPLKQGSPTKDIEIQFQRLKISEESDVHPVGQQPLTESGEQPKLVRGHFCPIKRKANSTKRGRGTLLKAQTRHQSLDSHPETASIDLNLVLEREFSVQSLTSVVNEEGFYETQSHGKS
jgi:T-lymphoma invasion and metastasis-inducing protein 2